VNSAADDAGPGARGVLLDFGQTVFRPSASSGQALVDTVARLGAAISPEEAAAALARIEQAAMVQTVEELGRLRDLSPEGSREAWTAVFAEAQIAAEGFAEAWYEWWTQPAAWEPYPEAERTLRELRARGVPVAIVSDTGWNIRSVFRHHRLERFVTAFVLSYEVGAVKPEPAMFLEACRALGVEPAEAVMVGDNPLRDGGAIRLGIPVLLVPPGAGRGEGLAQVLRLADGTAPPVGESASR
jgi:HAD superfamily hydrolase (TIGR01509 family)